MLSRLFRRRLEFLSVLITLFFCSRAAAQVLTTSQVAFGQPPVPGAYFGAALSTAYDNNVTERPGGAGAQGSWIDGARLLAGFDGTYDRQHVVASADIGRFFYRQESLFDYTAANIQADAKSNFPGNIDTDVGVSRTQVLARPADLNTIRNDVITRDTVNASVYFPIAIDWHSVLGANGSLLRNSNVTDQPTNLNAAEGDLGVRYQTGALNYVDLLARFAHSTYPDAAGTVYENNPYDDRGADLRTGWKFSESSQVVGHVGYLERRYENSYTLDFSGPTYDLTYFWTPSYKTAMTLYVLRQEGPAGESGYLAAVTHTYRVTPAYLVTEKIRLEAYYQWSDLGYYGNAQ